MVNSKYLTSVLVVCRTVSHDLQQGFYPSVPMIDCEIDNISGVFICLKGILGGLSIVYMMLLHAAVSFAIDLVAGPCCAWYCLRYFPCFVA